MPTVLLTRYECDRGLVPRVCARCGVPADDAVRVTVLDPVTHALMAASLTLCPPAFIAAATILHRRRAMRLPMCPADRADWEWRDRVTSRSYVFAVGVPYVAAIGVAVASFLNDWEPGIAIGLMGYLVMWTCWVAPTAVTWTRTVRTTKVTPEGIRLSGVQRGVRGGAGGRPDSRPGPGPADVVRRRARRLRRRAGLSAA